MLLNIREYTVPHQPLDVALRPHKTKPAKSVLLHRSESLQTCPCFFDVFPWGCFSWGVVFPRGSVCEKGENVGPSHGTRVQQASRCLHEGKVPAHNPHRAKFRADSLDLAEK